MLVPPTAADYTGTGSTGSLGGLVTAVSVGSSLASAPSGGIGHRLSVVSGTSGGNALGGGGVSHAVVHGVDGTFPSTPAHAHSMPLPGPGNNMAAVLSSPLGNGPASAGAAAAMVTAQQAMATPQPQGRGGHGGASGSSSGGAGGVVTPATPVTPVSTGGLANGHKGSFAGFSQLQAAAAGEKDKEGAPAQAE